MRRLLLIAVVLGAIASTGCKNVFGPSGEASYEISGTATRVDITYQNSTGGTSQIANVSLPWTYSLSNLKSGDFLYVSAQIVNDSGGSITVTINREGKSFKTGSASGFAAIGTASGSY